MLCLSLDFTNLYRFAGILPLNPHQSFLSSRILGSLRRKFSKRQRKSPSKPDRVSSYARGSLREQISSDDENSLCPAAPAVSQSSSHLFGRAFRSDSISDRMPEFRTNRFQSVDTSSKLRAPSPKRRKLRRPEENSAASPPSYRTSAPASNPWVHQFNDVCRSSTSSYMRSDQQRQEPDTFSYSGFARARHSRPLEEPDTECEGKPIVKTENIAFMQTWRRKRKTSSDHTTGKSDAGDTQGEHAKCTVSKVDLTDTVDEMAVPVEHPMVSAQARVKHSNQTAAPWSDTESEFGFESRRKRAVTILRDLDHRKTKDRTASSVIADATLNDWSSSSTSSAGYISAANMADTDSFDPPRPLFVVNASPRSQQTSVASLGERIRRKPLGSLETNGLGHEQRGSRDHNAHDIPAQCLDHSSTAKTSLAEPLRSFDSLNKTHGRPNSGTGVLGPRVASNNVRSFIQNFEDKILENKTQATRKTSITTSHNSSPMEESISKFDSLQLSDKHDRVRDWSERIHDVRRT